MSLDARVYGMKFADSPYAMPELYWRFGYPAVMIGMGAIAALMLAHFRRQDWLRVVWRRFFRGPVQHDL